MSRSAIAILSTKNIIHNIQLIRKISGDKKIIAMVKANAYGHGIRSVSQRIQDYVEMLGVASIDEAMALRGVDIKIPIILMEGVFDKDEIVISAENNLHIVFHSFHQIEWLEEVSKNLSNKKLKLNCWIKIDTGMGRLGFDYENGLKAYKKLSQILCVKKPINIMSHLASGEIKEDPLNQKQITEFKKFQKEIETIYNEVKIEYSFCNSGAILNSLYKESDFIRPGISIYGSSPVSNMKAKDIGFKPVMNLKTKVIAIKNGKKGDSIGYNGSYIVQDNITYAVIAFGYGDGYPRNVQNGFVLIQNKRCPIIGKISMDMMTVDISDIKNPKIGDDVLLWGEGLEIDEVAKFSNKITHELVTGIQNRVKFIWE